MHALIKTDGHVLPAVAFFPEPIVLITLILVPWDKLEVAKAGTMVVEEGEDGEIRRFKQHRVYESFGLKSVHFLYDKNNKYSKVEVHEYLWFL